MNTLVHMNYIAVLTCGVVYFVLGWLWYSALFAKIWVAGIQSIGIQMKTMEKEVMRNKMILNFVAAFLTALVVAYFVQLGHIHTIPGAVKFSIVAGIGLVGLSSYIHDLWINKPLSVTLIDVGYHFFGILFSAIILVLWS
jgi:hypothetical protein